MPEKDDRYASNWPVIADTAHNLTGRKCCWCCTEKSVEVHHVHYWSEGHAIKGVERPGTDVFPVCKPCHLELHQPHLWSQVFDPLARENTPSTIATLKQNYQEIRNARLKKP